MNKVAGVELATRESILKLLSDEEVARAPPQRARRGDLDEDPVAPSAARSTLTSTEARHGRT